MVQQPLDMFDPQKVLPVHRNNDRVPYLRNQDLGLVLDLHLGRRQQFRIYPLWKTGVNVLPRSPDRQTERKGAANAEYDDPDDVPEVRVEEEEDEVHDIHDSECERDMVRAKLVAKQPIVASLDPHAGHDRNGAAERGREEKVGFDEFTAKDEGQSRMDAVRAERGRVGYEAVNVWEAMYFLDLPATRSPNILPEGMIANAMVTTTEMKN
jgi:hypothetical protein